MVQKDLAGKTLEAIEEVFADIVNCIMFDGREVMKAGDLSDAEPRSQYKADGEYHEQVRDVAKYWNKCGIRMAFVGIENETSKSKSKYMPLRIISYDGGAYRAQLPKQTKKDTDQLVQEESKALYPAVSMVLYFGTDNKWEKNTSLKEVLTIPPELEPYVNDYRIHVVNVAFLERVQIDKFKSDFWFVADYFWQLRNNKNYTPSDKNVKYARQVLQMMSAMTGDNSFEKAYNDKKRESEKGGNKNMRAYINEAVEERERQEREKSIRILVVSLSEAGAADDFIARKLVENYELTPEQAKNKIEKCRPIPA